MSEDTDKNKSITRRSLLGLGAGAFAYQLLGPCAKAWAIDNPWGGWTKHLTECLGGRQTGEDAIVLPTALENNYGTLEYNSYGGARAQPIIWDFSKYQTGQTARLGAGLYGKVECTYANALYVRAKFLPLAQAYSYAPYIGTHYVGWHNTDPDNRYRLNVSLDGASVTEIGDTGCVFNLDSGYDNSTDHYNNAGDKTSQIYFENIPDGSDAAGRHWYERYSDYANWAVTEEFNLNIRRGYDERTVKLQAGAEYYNFFCNLNDHKATPGNNPDYHRDGYGFSAYMETPLYQKLPGTKKLGLCTLSSSYPSHCGIEWAGRICAICDAGDLDKSLITGDGTTPAGDGYAVGAHKKGDDWPDATPRLNRGWYIHLSYHGTTNPADHLRENDLDHKWKGTLVIANAMQTVKCGRGAERLDQVGGCVVPDTKASAGIYTSNDGKANQAFWIHTYLGRQYIISDASGLMLFRDYWDGEKLICNFHCDGRGFDYDLKNSNDNAWIMKDVYFKLRSGDALNIGSAEVEPGASISFQNLSYVEDNTYPHVGSGHTGLRYEYMWVRMKADQSDSYLTTNSKIHIEGKVYLEDYGDTEYYKPANNMLGAHNLKCVEALELKIANKVWDMGGGIAYRLCKDDGKSGKAEHWDQSNGCWDSWKWDGARTGAVNIGRKNHSIQAVLYGEISRFYTLRYRTGNSLGWSDWRDEGYICIAPQRTNGGTGSIIERPWIESIAIEIVPRAEVLDSAPYTTGNLPRATDAGANNNGPFSSGNMSRKVTVDDLNKKLVGVARAVLPSDAYDEPRYLGYVRTTTKKIRMKVNIHFIADGEEKWVKKDWYLGDPYTIPGEAVEACTRPTSTYLDKWYYDPNYTNKLNGGSFTPNDINTKDYYIYCRNQYTLTFKWADETRSFFGAHEPYAETGLSTRLYESPHMVPETIYRWHGNTLGNLTWHYTTAYVERSDEGGYMTTNAIKSVFANKSATDSSSPMPASTVIKGSATLYVVWKRPTYDGFDSN